MAESSTKSSEHGPEEAKTQPVEVLYRPGSGGEQPKLLNPRRRGRGLLARCRRAIHALAGRDSSQRLVGVLPAVVVTHYEDLAPDDLQRFDESTQALAVPVWWVPSGMSVTFIDSEGRQHVFTERRGRYPSHEQEAQES